ncbi:MAG: hypothetical protein GY749_16290 [Desulfobacteraceae bacterium]|nr:hypothetical protein [Desulfobacteraceae bacterium]
MDVKVGKIYANEVNIVEGTLNKWVATNQIPPQEEIGKLLEIIKEMQDRLNKLEFDPALHDGAVKYLEDAEVNLKGNSSDPKLVQTNLQETTKIVTEALITEMEKLNLDSKLQRKVKNSLETALIELDEEKPEPMTVEDGLIKASSILKETEGVMDKVKKIVPYAEMIGLWLGKTAQQLGWF